MRDGSQVGRRPSTDAEIIIESRSAPHRFAEIFDRHFKDIHLYIGQRLGNDAADDISAETFLIAFRSRTKFNESRDTARPWLYGIATNLISRHQRSELRRYQALARLDRSNVIESHEERVTSAVSAASNIGLGKALADLSGGDRDVLLLVALADLSYPEVAEALGVKYGTVCSRLSRARRNIRASLNDMDPTGIGVHGDG